MFQGRRKRGDDEGRNGKYQPRRQGKEKMGSKPLPDKGVTILSPKANDVVKRGSTYEIQWKAEPAESEFGAMVTVEFSKDKGKSWDKMEENVPNKGKYRWNVPNVDSTECKVRVFPQYRPIYRGTSEMFSVK